jgi:hypothetical protein
MTVLPTELVDKLHNYMTCVDIDTPKPCKRHKYVYTTSDLLLAAWSVYPQLLLNIDNETTIEGVEFPDELFDTIYCDGTFDQSRADHLKRFYINIALRLSEIILIPIKHMNKKILNHMLENKMCSLIVDR